MATSRVAGESDVGRVAAEVIDVVRGPFESEALVPETEVGGVGGGGERGGREEAEDVKPVGGGDDDAFYGGGGEEGAEVEGVGGAILEEAAVFGGLEIKLALEMSYVEKKIPQEIRIVVQ